MFYGVLKEQVDAFEYQFITSMASILSVDSSEISFTTSQIGKDVIVHWKFSKSIVITRSDSSLDDLLIAEMSNQGSFTDLLSIVIYQRQISAVSVSDVDFYRDELVQTMLDAVDDLNAIVDVSFISSGTDVLISWTVEAENARVTISDHNFAHVLEMDLLQIDGLNQLLGSSNDISPF